MVCLQKKAKGTKRPHSIGDQKVPISIVLLLLMKRRFFFSDTGMSPFSEYQMVSFSRRPNCILLQVAKSHLTQGDQKVGFSRIPEGPPLSFHSWEARRYLSLEVQQTFSSRLEGLLLQQPRMFPYLGDQEVFICRIPEGIIIFDTSRSQQL